MTVAVTYHSDKKRDELHFSRSPDPETAAFLKDRIGLRPYPGDPRRWYGHNHPAYHAYTKELAASVNQGGSVMSVGLRPSFRPSGANIENRKFSYVTITHEQGGQPRQAAFVVFDPYKKVATYVAEAYGKATYGDAYQGVTVSPRNYKQKARKLLEAGKVIDPKPNAPTPATHPASAADSGSVDRKHLLDSFLAFVDKRQKEFPEVTIEDHELPLLLSGWLRLNHPEHAPLKNELAGILERQQQQVHRSSAKLAELGEAPPYARPQPPTSNAPTPATHPVSASDSHETAIVGEVRCGEKRIPNVLLPAASKEPFWSGCVPYRDARLVLVASPDLIHLTDDNVGEATPLQLFELSQLPHPTDYQLHVSRSALLSAWTEQAATTFQALGLPTDPSYPYVNIHTGYRSVEPLGDLLGDGRDKWWSVAEHYRPIADMGQALALLEDQLRALQNQQAATLNPKTGKPKGAEKATYDELAFKLHSLLESKAVIAAYRTSTQGDPSSPGAPPGAPPGGYLDRVVAHLHDAYAGQQRLSKGQIEKLGEELNIPNKGMLWEAVELSWMLWYRNLYREPLPFDVRLAHMVRFWNDVQPTYAYSDSSKELYRQYSTPCPIGAMVAQYTDMDTAARIFDPSAGNGLLLVGADPARTHANEIDPTRFASLAFAGFRTLTSYNATQPFPKALGRSFDVVVTNPPFSRWEEKKRDKAHLIQTYFHGHRDLEHHLRLEHVMCGLALHTMQDTGRAALIIMGHLVFSKEDGLINKYRPFFNWLYRHYEVKDVINLNSFKLYNKQGAVERTMLILIHGRKSSPGGHPPTQSEAPELEAMVDSFTELWERIRTHPEPALPTNPLKLLIQQLKTALEP